MVPGERRSVAAHPSRPPASRIALGRRELLVAGLGTAIGWSTCARAALPWSSRPAPRQLQFFSATEAAFVDAAVARLIPADDLGPGALEAGVTVFIDRQLAGPYGGAVDWYMAGPWAPGLAEQGYQSRRTPAELYRAAIAAIDGRVRGEAGRPFHALPSARQDEFLHALEDDGIDLGDIRAGTFFKLLWNNTQEGYFADPIYEGNRDFIGWKLIGYPGPRYNYVGAIRHYGTPYPLPTVGLMGRDPTRRREGRV